MTRPIHDTAWNDRTPIRGNIVMTHNAYRHFVQHGHPDDETESGPAHRSAAWSAVGLLVCIIAGGAVWTWLGAAVLRWLGWLA